MEKQALGTLIKKYREDNKISLRTFSEKIGCAHETIRKIEADKEIPSFEIMDSIANQLNLPLREIIKLAYQKVEYKGNNYYRTYLTDNELKERRKLI